MSTQRASPRHDLLRTVDVSESLRRTTTTMCRPAATPHSTTWNLRELLGRSISKITPRPFEPIDLRPLPDEALSARPSRSRARAFKLPVLVLPSPSNRLMTSCVPSSINDVDDFRSRSRSRSASERCLRGDPVPVPAGVLRSRAPLAVGVV